MTMRQIALLCFAASVAGGAIVDATWQACYRQPPELFRGPSRKPPANTPWEVAEKLME